MKKLFATLLFVLFSLLSSLGNAASVSINTNGAVSGILVAATVDTITGAAGAVCVAFQIFNRSPTVDLWMRVDGINPVASGADSFLIPPNQDRIFNSFISTSPQVRLISAGGIGYSVECK